MTRRGPVRAYPGRWGAGVHHYVHAYGCATIHFCVLGPRLALDIGVLVEARRVLALWFGF